MDLMLLLPLSFFVVAALYASVGMGGATAYLAILALAGFPHGAIPPIALLLNLIVSGSSFTNYWRAGHFSAKLLLPFVLPSIPAAFLGGLIPMPEKAFSILLSLILLGVSLRMLTAKAIQARCQLSWGKAFLVGIPLGVLLGLLAGLVGFGGGIFLSPILLFLGWAGAKETAATTSAFIFLNSASGLLSRSLQGLPNLDSELIIFLALAVFLGGQLGSYLGARRLSPILLQRVFGAVILAAAIKLMARVAAD